MVNYSHLQVILAFMQFYIESYIDKYLYKHRDNLNLVFLLFLAPAWGSNPVGPIF